VTEQDKIVYLRDGYLTLPNVMTEDEMKEIDVHYQKFLNREVTVPDRDFCDMSQKFDVPFEDWNMINAMLPTIYLPEWKDNIYEKRALSIANQLLGDDMTWDYNQLLAKKPGKTGAIFAWHQDLGYWPQSTPDTKTATVSLAVDNSVMENGCIRMVPGSHLEKELRKHDSLAKKN